jgi:hypothetical protein
METLIFDTAKDGVYGELGGHFLGQIILDRFMLYCIYIMLLNNSAGHSDGHFGNYRFV